MSNVGARRAQLSASFDVLHKSVGISWLPVSGPAMSHYRVYRAEGADKLTPLADTAGTAYRDADVRAGTTYTYAVCAVSDVGVESPKSVPISLTVAWHQVYLPVVIR